MSFDDLIGREIDGFQIEERLGQGAMATVYRAYQPSINRHVALKIIRLDHGLGQQEDFRKRFAQEAEVIARLEHIHILPIYAYGITTELAYLAMRWLKGGSLSELLRKDRLALERTADIIKQVAQGLAYAHSKGVIHRDLKPSNIMLDDEGNAYLTDFGLAKFAEGSTEITKSGTIVGTPAYMSPEQLRGEPLDRRSDIYSLGVLLYMMAAGRLPFDTSTSDLVSIIYQHLETDPTPPSEFNPQVTAEVEAVIFKALSKDREERFDTADSMARALNAALGRSTSDTMLVPSVNRLRSKSRPRLSVKARQSQRQRLYLVAGIVVIIALMAALLFNQINTDNQTRVAQTAQAVAAAETLTAAGWTPTPPPTAVVQAGEYKPSAEVVPSAEEIQRAKARLGVGGFIAYIACSLDSEFHSTLAREIRDLTTRYGLTARVYDGEASAYKQITLIERARSDGAGALIVCPLDAKLLADSLTSAQGAGIPMSFFADNMPSYGGVLVGGDNYLLGLEPGRLAGKLITAERGGKANVIILDFPDRPDIVARANGLEDGVLEYAPNAKIVGRFKGATPDFAKESVGKLIKDGVKFDVIVSINDAGSFGAISAMEAAGFDPKAVIITSVDGEALAQQYIRRDYYIRGSVQSARKESSEALVNSMVKLLAGATLPEFVLVPPGPMLTKASLEQAGTPTPGS
jgi:serine/threonine protein kinase/DNA-binding LacI/PurR family transcriptional regulator